MRLAIHKLSPSATIPHRGTPLSAGLDLYANGHYTLAADGGKASISTGIAMAIPRGYYGAVVSRSGLERKHGIVVANAPGIIDCDYRGEVIVRLRNDSGVSFDIDPGMRIAQLVITEFVPVLMMEVEALPETARGGGGFGSTGD